MHVIKLISSLMMVTILHLFTLFSLSAIIVSLAENISIDCGSAGSYVDSKNVTWVGDKDFVTTGESLQIPGVVTKPTNTLRYFPSGESNCYTNIPVTKHRRTLVRTKFYYGNYDGKSSSPSFDVVYDGKHRESIESSESYDDETFFFSEVIFAPASENISVCVIRMSPSEDPFISSIEVYSLDAGMYDDLGPDEGLILGQRFAYGAKELISYPSDRYGRLWYPSPLGSGDNPALTDLKTSAPSIDITGASNKPPEMVMSKATSGAILILPDLALPLPLTGLPVYLALYFTEPESLGRTQRRSFSVFLDSTEVAGPIVPVWGKATQVVLRDVVATSGSRIVFRSTDDSVLPPIVNGLELYSISKVGANGVVINKGSERATPRANNAEEDGENNNGVKKKKKKKTSLIVGVTFASAFAMISSAFGAIFLRKRQNAKPQSNTAPTMSTGHGTTGTGMSPLVEQQFASDIENSYVVQNDDIEHGP